LLLLAAGAAAQDGMRVRLLSSLSPGDAAAGASFVAGVGGEGGRYVVFTSSAVNLVPGQVDRNRASDVFWHDRSSGQTRLLTRAAGTAATTANGYSEVLGVSEDGQRVLIRSVATDLVAGVLDDNAGNQEGRDLFVYDAPSDRLVLVSKTSGAPLRTLSRIAFAAFLSRGGGHVLFSSADTDVADGVTDANASFDTFVFDVATGTSRLVSHAAGSPLVASSSGGVPGAISGDGRVVAFVSSSDNLRAGVSAPTEPQAWLRDLAQEAPRLLSHLPGQPTVPSANPSDPSMRLSRDGARVAYRSRASNLVPGQDDANFAYDVFLYDTAQGSNALASHRPGQAAKTGGAEARLIALSGDGRRVVFEGRNADFATPGVLDGPLSTVMLFDATDGSVMQVSRPHPAQDPESESRGVGISDDGNRVLFRSTGGLAWNSEENGGFDAFLFDVATQSTRLVSHLAGNATRGADGVVATAAMDPSGRHVVFDHTGARVAPGITDNNRRHDAFAYDTQSGQAVLVSRGVFRTPLAAVYPSDATAVSADGRHVLLESSDGGIVSPPEPDTLGSNRDVILADLRAGTRTAASHAAGQPGVALEIADSEKGLLTPDGEWIVFASAANAVFPYATPTYDRRNVFLMHRATRQIRLVSHAPGQANVSGGRYAAPVHVTRNGRFVLFHDDATALVPGITDANGDDDLFLFDAQTGEVSLVSKVAGEARTAHGASRIGAVSEDGRFVAFESRAHGLLPDGQTLGGWPTVYLLDRQAGSLRRLTNRPEGPGIAYFAAMTADGSHVFFNSAASGLVAGVTDAGGEDVFVHDREAGTLSLVSHAHGLPATAAGGHAVALSDDGTRLLINSASSDFDALADANGVVDAFVRDWRTGETWRASARDGGVHAGGGEGVALSGDGNRVVIEDDGTSLVDGVVDGNGPGRSDVFLYDLAQAQMQLLTPSLFDPARSANGDSHAVVASHHGGTVIVESKAFDLVGGYDGPGWTRDVFAIETPSRAMLGDGFEE